MSISTEENVSASWESVQRQDLKQKPTKAQKMICHCVPQTPAWGWFEWAKIPSRNSPKLSVEGLKETWRPGGWQCWAPLLLHCAHLAGVGQLGSQGTQTLCRVTQDRDYLQISLFTWIYLGSIHWHRALEIKYPRNKRVWSQFPLTERNKAGIKGECHKTLWTQTLQPQALLVLPPRKCKKTHYIQHRTQRTPTAGTSPET